MARHLKQFGKIIFDPADLLAIHFVEQNGQAAEAEGFLALENNDASLVSLTIDANSARSLWQQLAGVQMQMTVLHRWAIKRSSVHCARQDADGLHLLFGYGSRGLTAWVTIAENDDIVKFMGIGE